MMNKNNKKMCSCINCKCGITTANIEKHFTRCIVKGPKKPYSKEYFNRTECKYCKRDCKNSGGLSAHEPFCKLNPERTARNRSPNAGKKKGSISWNKGLIGDPRCKRTEEYKLSMKGKSTGKGSTAEKEADRISKITEKAKLNNGGYHQGSGRGKKGWYKEFFCDSSYELAYVIFCIEHNIDIQRNTQKYQYNWEGKIKNYIPDFIVEGDIVEIKGYNSDQWQAKLKCLPNIIVLYEEDLTEVFSYVISKYGKNYIDLYENRKTI